MTAPPVDIAKAFDADEERSLPNRYHAPLKETATKVALLNELGRVNN
jgi:hypothetical protein